MRLRSHTRNAPSINPTSRTGSVPHFVRPPLRRTARRTLQKNVSARRLAPAEKGPTPQGSTTPGLEERAHPTTTSSSETRDHSLNPLDSANFNGKRLAECPFLLDTPAADHGASTKEPAADVLQQLAKPSLVRNCAPAAHSEHCMFDYDGDCIDMEPVRLASSRGSTTNVRMKLNRATAATLFPLTHSHKSAKAAAVEAPQAQLHSAHARAGAATAGSDSLRVAKQQSVVAENSVCCDRLEAEMNVLVRSMKTFNTSGHLKEGLVVMKSIRSLSGEEPLKHQASEPELADMCTRRADDGANEAAARCETEHIMSTRTR
jgi:hypothetical protein